MCTLIESKGKVGRGNTGKGGGYGEGKGGYGKGRGGGSVVWEQRADKQSSESTNTINVTPREHRRRKPWKSVSTFFLIFLHFIFFILFLILFLQVSFPIINLSEQYKKVSKKYLFCALMCNYFSRKLVALKNIC